MKKQNISCHKTQAFNLLHSDVYPFAYELDVSTKLWALSRFFVKYNKIFNPCI